MSDDAGLRGDARAVDDPAMATLLLDLVAAFWNATAEMAPYLLLGFGVAGLLSVFVSPALVERHLSGAGIWPVTKATLVGIPLPLCSCGVIPVAASLRAHGASRGATTSFLLSTPQTGVDSILVTYSLLGPVYAIFRPLAALATGIAGGLVVSRVAHDESPSAASAACDDGCAPGTSQARSLRGALHYGFVALPRDIGRSLVLGLVIAAGIGVFVPDDFAGSFGVGLPGMLAMLLVGVPVYVCATGSVPIAAALIAKGVSPGAALVFLMTGPATNAAAIATVWKVLGRKTAITYLAVVIVGALAFGFVLDAIFAGTAPDVGHVHTHGGRAWWQHGSAIALVILLGYALLTRRPASGTVREREIAMKEESLRLSIEGMNCGHCVNSVERALRESAGVSGVTVSLEEKSAVVLGTVLDAPSLKARVEALGFTVTAVGPSSS